MPWEDLGNSSGIWISATYLENLHLSSWLDFTYPSAGYRGYVRRKLTGRSDLLPSSSTFFEVLLIWKEKNCIRQSASQMFMTVLTGPGKNWKLGIQFVFPTAGTQLSKPSLLPPRVLIDWMPEPAAELGFELRDSHRRYRNRIQRLNC